MIINNEIAISELLNGIDYTVINGDDGRKVKAVCYDTRDMKADSVYVCIKGNSYDGHALVKEAVYKGAIAIVAEDDTDIDDSITVIKVRSSRQALAYMSAAYFGHPARKLLMIGITGTKGKTTTAYMIENILKAAGMNVGIIGSIEVRYGKVTLVNENTTPESYRIHELLNNMLSNGVQAVVMEVSSQAIKLKRVEGLEFDYAIYTNMSEDHIGPAEHKDMEEYIDCKSRLFGHCKKAVFNINDIYVNKMIEKCRTDYRVYYGVEGEKIYSDMDNIYNQVKKRNNDRLFFANNIKLKVLDGVPGTEFLLIDPANEYIFDINKNDKIEVNENNQDNQDNKDNYVKNKQGKNCFGKIILRLPGEYSVYNALAAIAVCSNILKNDEQTSVYDLMADVLSHFTVKGRMEVIDSGMGFTVIVDYAHNELSLQCLLMSLREYTDGKLVCLFGCGGNRSKTRRYKMGEVSARYADVTIVTDDNPRFEPPEDIRHDIETGILKVLDKDSRTDFNREYTTGTYILQPDREKAIQNALSNASKNDIIVVAGKGHENYQEIKGVRYPLNDTEIVRHIFQSGVTATSH